MDHELENLIDRAGRDAVFSRARALGWSPANSPPAWVWHQIAAELLSAQTMAQPQRISGHNDLNSQRIS